MIKRAYGDWTRPIPPWAEVRNCDLRFYRGPYCNIQEEMAQKQRAVSRLGAAFKRARASGVEVIVFRVGVGRAGRDTFRPLVLELICDHHADAADLERSRLYRDRIVVLLTAPRTDPANPFEPGRQSD